jgi:glucosylceramidase
MHRISKLTIAFAGFIFILSPVKSAAQKSQPEVKSIVVYTTAAGTSYRLNPTDTLEFVPAHNPVESEIAIFVNPSVTFQTLMGIGGAITDASAEVFARLPADKQNEIITAYYDKEKGIGYSLGRTNILSCDFSSSSYSYVEEGDKELKSFSIAHDLQYRIPMIRRAIEATGGKLTLFASPWSPPAFMKDNNNVLHGGRLLPEYYSSWALFYAKFIKAYEKEHVPIWGISVQNEPLAVQTWESCNYTAEEERDFLKIYLGPTLEKEGLKDKKIIIWDHNRDFLPLRASVILNDPEAAKYVWGVGFHWYETWTGGQPMFDNVKVVHEAYPSANMLFTEGCAESFSTSKYQSWPNGEKYGIQMINDFNNGTVGWTDWNILLDEEGGPNHVGNFCMAPIHADTRTGEIIYTPSYYYIGHFSKFIRPHAKRVSTASSRSVLLSTSFINEDGKMATVVLNPTDKAVNYYLFTGSHEAGLIIPPHAIQTLVY